MPNHQTPPGRRPDIKGPGSGLLSQLSSTRLIGGGTLDFQLFILSVVDLPQADLLPQVRRDQSQRWRQGEPVPLEAYLEHLPALREQRDAVLELIEAEMRLRSRSELPPTAAEYEQRFPDHAAEIARRFEAVSAEQEDPLLAADAAAAPPAQPAAPSGSDSGIFQSISFDAIELPDMPPSLGELSGAMKRPSPPDFLGDDDVLLSASKATAEPPAPPPPPPPGRASSLFQLPKLTTPPGAEAPAAPWLKGAGQAPPPPPAGVRPPPESDANYRVPLTTPNDVAKQTPANLAKPAAGAGSSGSGFRLSAVGGSSGGFQLPSPGAAGQSIAGYTVLEELGATPTHVTYKVRPTGGQGDAVLKRWTVVGPEADTIRGRLADLQEALAGVDSPNLAAMYDVNDDQGRAVLVREYLAGGSLADLLQGTALPPRPVAYLVQCLAAALHAAHEKGVVHGRVKPANVLFAWDRPVPPVHEVSSVGELTTMFGTAKLADFAHQPPSDRPVASAPGEPARLFDYYAPEQARGRGAEVGPATDVHALGAVLYELLTGRPPFRSALPAETLRQIADERPVPPTRWQPRVPPHLELIALKCLQKQPAYRYPTAAALASDLQAYLSGKTPSVVRTEEKPPPGPPPSRGRRLLVAGGVVAVLVACAFLAGPYYFPPATTPPPDNPDQQVAVNPATQGGEVKTPAVAGADPNAGGGTTNPTNAGGGTTPSANAGGATTNPSAGTTNAGGGTPPVNPPSTTQNPPDPPVKPVTNDAGGNNNNTKPPTPPDVGSKPPVSPEAARQQQLYFTRLNQADGALQAHRYCQAADLLDGCPEGQRGWEWHVLRQQAAKRLLTLPAPDARARGVTASADGGTILTVGPGPKSLVVWDGRTGEARQTLAGHTCVAVSPDGRWATALGEKDQVLLYDLNHPELPARSLPGHTAAVRALAFSPRHDRFASASDDGTVRVWPTIGADPPLVLTGAGGPVSAVAFNTDGTFVAAAHADTVHFWQLSGDRQGVSYPAKVPFTIASPSNKPFTAVAFSPDAKTIATAGADNRLHFWELRDGRLLKQFEGHTQPPQSLAFTADGRRIASTGWDGTVRVWDVYIGWEVGQYDGLHAVAFAGPDGGRLVAPQRDRQVAVWDAAPKPPPPSLPNLAGRTYGLAMLGDAGRTWVTGGEDGRLILWDARRREPLAAGRAFAPAVQALAASPDGAWLAVATGTYRFSDSAAGDLRLVNVDQNRDVTLTGHRGSALGLAFSHDGRLVASGGVDDTVRVWDVATGRQVHLLLGAKSLVYSVAFSPDGKTLAAASADGKLRTWRVADGQPAATLDGAGSPLYAVAYSPDGAYLVAGGRSGSGQVWDAATGRELTLLAGHTKSIRGLAFHKDGLLASAGADGTVRLWDVAGGRELAVLTQPDAIYAVTFSPDGRYLLTGGEDHSVRIWDGAPAK